jgi:hypothetical protein
MDSTIVGNKKEQESNAEKGQERSSKKQQDLGNPASPDTAWVRPTHAARQFARPKRS